MSDFILIPILIISLSLNVLMFFYVRWLFKQFAQVGSEIEVVKKEVDGFNQHLNSIYELEMFYGDDTLGSLMSHGKELSALLEDFDFLLQEAPPEPEEQDNATEE